MIQINPQTSLSEGPVSLQAPFWQQLTYQVESNSTVVSSKIEIDFTLDANDKALVLHAVHAFGVTASSGNNARLWLMDENGTSIYAQQWRHSSVYQGALELYSPVVMPDGEGATVKLNTEAGDTITAGTVTVFFATIFRGKIISHPTGVSAT